VRVGRTALPEVLVIEPKVFGDARGFFQESWNKARFDEAVGHAIDFVQDNHSRSSKGVLRGIHFQKAPKAQGKLVRVVAGSVFDIAVDLRRSSPRLGQWVGVELSADNHRQLWIPPGFGHGYLTLSDTADFLYKATDYYAPEHEASLAWNDSHVGVEWPLAQLGMAPVLSGKDAAAPGWKDCPLFD
jgi:dTDP-4-dehydrorhamnose 3,5-epimerase